MKRVYDRTPGSKIRIGGPSSTKSGITVSSGSGGSGGGGSPHNPPASPIFLETFDNAGGSGYDLAGWFETLNAGTVDQDYTGIVLDGTQSLRIASAGSTTWTERSLASLSEVWGFFQFRAESVSAGEKSIFELQDNLSARQFKVTAQESGGQVALKVYVDTSSLSLIALMDIGVKYNCWIYYNRDNGSNAIGSFAFSASTTRPTSGDNYREVSNPPLTPVINKFCLGVAGSDFGDDVVFLYDYALADDVQIGDNP